MYVYTYYSVCVYSVYVCMYIDIYIYVYICMCVCIHVTTCNDIRVLWCIHITDILRILDLLGHFYRLSLCGDGL